MKRREGVHDEESVNSSRYDWKRCLKGRKLCHASSLFLSSSDGRDDEGSELANPPSLYSESRLDWTRSEWGWWRGSSSSASLTQGIKLKSRREDKDSTAETESTSEWDEGSEWCASSSFASSSDLACSIEAISPCTPQTRQPWSCNSNVTTKATQIDWTDLHCFKLSRHECSDYVNREDKETICDCDICSTASARSLHE